LYYSPNEENIEYEANLWGKIAEKFKNYPEKLSFDLLIEPSKQLNKHPEILNKFIKVALEKIRQTNPTRIVFIETIQRANPEYLNKLDIPSGKYLMIQFHFCASGPYKNKSSCKWTSGTLQERQNLEKRVKLAYDFQQSHHIPVWF